ncbi:hypothetical protein B0H14DRAFT_2578147 [Mycena olivaceomarginata]|nr:hypothetical protein B0H14DRAFT_2578147 [Mycena olivaceomarginata]
MSSFNIFWCISNTTIPTDLRGYVTSTTPLLPDGMVSFAVCTAQSTAIPPTADPSASNSLILDALTFYVLPGDPSSDIYNDQLPDQFTSMAYGVGRVSGGPQILDGDHSSRVVTVGVVDYVRGDTKASAVHSTSTPSAPVVPAKRRKFDYPSPSLAPAPSTSVSMATFTSSSSNTTFSQQHCSALEPADSGVNHTVKHTHTYSNIHRIFDLIDFRDCVVTQTSCNISEIIKAPPLSIGS